MLGYKDEKGKPYSPVYLKTLHNQLSAVFNHAVRHYNLKANPAAQVGNMGKAKAGVKRIRIHDLRHSHISLLIDMGFTALAIADRVGHESIDITYRYAHLFPTRQAEKAREHPWRPLARGGRYRVPAICIFLKDISLPIWQSRKTSERMIFLFRLGNIPHGEEFHCIAHGERYLFLLILLMLM